MPDSTIHPVATAALLTVARGCRLQSPTNETPKYLAEVNGIAILKHLVHRLRKHGFARLVVVIGHSNCTVPKFLDLRCRTALDAQNRTGVQL